MSIELTIHDLKDVKVETYLDRGRSKSNWVDITFTDNAGERLTVTAFGGRGIVASLSHALETEFKERADV